MKESPIPCRGCNRQYGHLPDCSVKALHASVDSFVAQFGPEKVLVMANYHGLPLPRGSVVVHVPDRTNALVDLAAYYQEAGA
jgi:hypothetical protein